eukprot:s1327_g25.t1
MDWCGWRCGEARSQMLQACSGYKIYKHSHRFVESRKGIDSLRTSVMAVHYFVQPLKPPRCFKYPFQKKYCKDKDQNVFSVFGIFVFHL